MITLDTNILVYSIDHRDPLKQAIAKEIVGALYARNSPICLQVVGEFCNAVNRRLKRPPWDAAQAARNIAVSFRTFGVTRDDVLKGLAETATGQFSYWDATLIAACESVGCLTFFSEDMQDGYQYGGMRIVNPFGSDGLSKAASEVLGAK